MYFGQLHICPCAFSLVHAARFPCNRGETEMSRIKVAFCISDMIIGGVETVFLQTMAEILAHDDIEISVIMRQKLREQYFIDWFKQHPQVKLYTLHPLADWFEHLRKYTHGFPLENIRRIAYGIYKRFKNHLAMRRGIFACQDILIDYKNCEFARQLRNCCQPKIAWIHGSINYFEYAHLAQYMDIYDRVVCLTDSFVSDFKQQYPQYADKIVRIYNPVDVAGIRAIAASRPAYPGKYFCCVSRLTPDKDIQTVISAFDKFVSHSGATDVKLLIIGTGSTEQKLRAQATATKCASQIEFMGAIPTPFGYMAHAMANILSSHNEGLGMVLLESAALGAICISSDCKNGPAEILMQGRAGILFAPGNSDQLADAMRAVYRGGPDIEKMRENATRGLERFATAKISAEIVELLNDVVSSRGGKCQKSR